MISKNKLKYIHSLEQKKARQREGVFVAEGTKIVSELLLAGQEDRKKGVSLVFMINKRTRQVSQRILNPVGHLAGCLFGVVFYKDSSTSFQSINPLPVSSSSTARAMTLRLSDFNFLIRI